MDYKINTQTKYTAALDISKIQDNYERWQNIAKAFKKKTLEFPEDTLEILDGSNYIQIIAKHSSARNKPIFIFIGSVREKLLNLSNKEIVTKLKKLLPICSKSTAVEAESNKNFQELFKMINQKGSNKLQLKFANSAHTQEQKKELAAMIDELSNDPILSKITILP